MYRNGYYSPNEKYIPFEKLHKAYLDCRKTKRSKDYAVEFEIGYVSKLNQLCDDLNHFFEGKYQIGVSDCFVVPRPVKREVFAGNFRDRIVHHLLFNEINPILEKYHYKDCAYACRKGKGTLYGSNDIFNKIIICTDNFQKQAYVCKCDIKSFFMSIPLDNLANRMRAFLMEYFPDSYSQKQLIIELMDMVIRHRPQYNCNKLSDESAWDDIPPEKTLFGRDDVGLPIGNLTSQMLENFYLTFLDRYVMDELGFEFYGRYVDDFVIISEDKEKILQSLPKIRTFLKDELGLTLHPKKFYFQSTDKGLTFLGIKDRKGFQLPAGYSVGNFYKTVRAVSKMKITTIHQAKLAQARINSYLGSFKSISSKRFRTFVLDKFKIGKEKDGWFARVPGDEKIAINKNKISLI